MLDIDPFGDTVSPQPEPKQPEVTSEPVVKEDAEKASTTKPTVKKRGGLAYSGKLVDAPDMNDYNNYERQWPALHNDDIYVPDEEVDYQDLSSLNREIMRQRSMSFRVKNRLTEARQEETDTSDIYRRAYNRQLLGLSGGTVEVRKAQAEVATEDLYSDFLVAQTVVKDITNLSYTVSRDLDVLKTLSDNLRKQMSIQ